MVKKKQPAEKELVVSDVDTTRRTQAEKALQMERDRAQQYLDIAGVILVCLAPDQTITLINRKGCELLGYAQKELIGKNWFDTVLPEDERQKVKAVFAQLIKGELEPVEHVENYVHTRGGEKRLISWHNTLVKDVEGNLTGTLSSGQDITEGRRVDEALRESQERYRRITEGLTDYFYTVRLQDGQVVETTHGPACKAVTGYSEKKFADNPDLWISMVAPEDRGLVIEQVQRILAGENIPPMEHRIVRKDGQIRWVSDTPILQFDSENRLVSYDGVIKDITERKQAEEAIQNSEEKFRTLYENAPVLIDAFDNNGHCILWNQECQKVFGWTIDEINAHAEPLALFYPDPDIRREVVDSVTSQPGNIFREWHPLTKEGKELTVLWANFRLPGEGVINIGHDITERKRLEEEQQKVAKLESIGLLAAGIAHNFNNILTVILGNISLVKMDSKPGSENHEILEQAEKASLRAKDLTAQLLTFAKGGAPVKKMASLTELLKDTTSSTLSGSNVKCHFTIPADLRQAEIDAVQVSQVIHNLVINAQQAMPAGGAIEILAENITISTTNGTDKESMLEAGDYVRISVTDHGSGIPEKNMDKIFDPFFTTKIKAVGLGLATSFSIARRHGGHIRVESEPGAGSTVYVYLPIARES